MFPSLRWCFLKKILFLFPSLLFYWIVLTVHFHPVSEDWQEKTNYNTIVKLNLYQWVWGKKKKKSTHFTLNHYKKDGSLFMEIDNSQHNTLCEGSNSIKCLDQFKETTFLCLTGPGPWSSLETRPRCFRGSLLSRCSNSLNFDLRLSTVVCIETMQLRRISVHDNIGCLASICRLYCVNSFSVIVNAQHSLKPLKFWQNHNSQFHWETENTHKIPPTWLVLFMVPQHQHRRMPLRPKIFSKSLLRFFSFIYCFVCVFKPVKTRDLVPWFLLQCYCVKIINHLLWNNFL